MSKVEREYNLSIREEEGMLWAEVVELPGTFASGPDLDTLLEAVVEAIEMVESPVADPADIRESASSTRGHLRDARVVLT